MLKFTTKKTKIEARKQEREDEVEALEKISEILSALNLSLESQSGDEKYTASEVSDQEEKTDQLESDFVSMTADLDTKKIRKKKLFRSL